MNRPSAPRAFALGLLMLCAAGALHSLARFLSGFSPPWATHTLLLLFVSIIAWGLSDIEGLQAVADWKRPTLFIWGGVLGTSAVAVTVGIGVLTGAVTIAGRQGTAAAALLSLLPVHLAVAAHEEILFRGLLLRIVCGRWGRFLGVTVSALAFSLFHIGQHNLQGLMTTFVLGIGLALLYVSTRSLWIAVGYHMLFNLSQLTIADSLILHDSNWVMAGGFGIEAWPLTFLVLTCLLVPTAVWFQLQRRLNSRSRFLPDDLTRT